MKSLLIKFISLVGLGSIGTGLGLGMDANHSDPWEIGVAVGSVALSWIVAHASGTYYFKAKAFIHEISDALDDDKFSVQEIRDIVAAWKTGKYQPDVAAGKRRK